MKKKVYFLLFWAGIFSAFVLHGCDSGSAEIPSYVRIDEIPLDSTSYDSVGSTSNKIQYGWVYLNDNLQGVYKLPVAFPVLEQGDFALKVFAGVSESGFSDRASRYPYYAPWTKNVTLSQGETLHVFPHVKYMHGQKFNFIEDFEQNVFKKFTKVTGDGSFDYRIDPSLAYEGQGFGYLYMPPSDSSSLFVVETDLEWLPKDAAGYFVELNYRNNVDFAIGIRAGGTVNTNLILGLKPKAEWNKLYLNITSAVDALRAYADAFSVYIQVNKTPNYPEVEIFLDNFKIVY